MFESVKSAKWMYFPLNCLDFLSIQFLILILIECKAIEDFNPLGTNFIVP